MLLFETVLSTVICLVAGVGLGAWVPIKSISGRVMVGSALVPIILLVLNIGTGLTLSDIALLISGSSVIGCIWFFRTVRKQENLWSLTNPVLILPVLFIGSLLSFHEVGYQVFDGVAVGIDDSHRERKNDILQQAICILGIHMHRVGQTGNYG